MDYPKPEVGLVISYQYLWRDESDSGLIEGRKPRPCVMVLAVQNLGGTPVVTVAPITHSMPRDPSVAVQIPVRVASHLGLDHNNSYVVLDEYNRFTWPGYDIVPSQAGAYVYGQMPQRFFEQLVEKFDEIEQRPVSRDDPPKTI